MYIHKGLELFSIRINSINLNKKKKLSELESFFMCVQKMVDDRKSEGKKGIKLSNGQKVSYDQLQAILYELNSYFGLKGCFTNGTCSSCSKFMNGCTATGMIGYCAGQEKHAFDNCKEHKE